MDLFTPNGTMYDPAQDDSPNSAQGGHLLSNDTEIGWYCNSSEGRPTTSRDTTQHVAPDDGQHTAHCKATQSAPTNIFIVDVEGFQISKDFFVKELAFYNPESHKMWHGLFKPPFDKVLLKKKGLKCIDFCTEQFHGLRWEHGDYPYSALYSIISHFAANAILYAKGAEKCKWLQQFTAAPIFDLEQLGCPPSQHLPHGCPCPQHNTLKWKCALDKAVRFGKYFANIFMMVPPPPPPSPELFIKSDVVEEN